MGGIRNLICCFSSAMIPNTTSVFSSGLGPSIISVSEERIFSQPTLELAYLSPYSNKAETCFCRSVASLSSEAAPSLRWNSSFILSLCVRSEASSNIIPFNLAKAAPLHLFHFHFVHQPFPTCCIPLISSTRFSFSFSFPFTFLVPFSKIMFWRMVGWQILYLSSSFDFMSSGISPPPPLLQLHIFNLTPSSSVLSTSSSKSRVL